jgi:hypothetical protein
MWSNKLLLLCTVCSRTTEHAQATEESHIVFLSPVPGHKSVPLPEWRWKESPLQTLMDQVRPPRAAVKRNHFVPECSPCGIHSTFAHYRWGCHLWKMVWTKRSQAEQANQKRPPLFLAAVATLSRASSQVNFSPHLCPLSLAPWGRAQPAQLSLETLKTEGLWNCRSQELPKVTPGNWVEALSSQPPSLDTKARQPCRQLQKTFNTLAV